MLGGVQGALSVFLLPALNSVKEWGNCSPYLIYFPSLMEHCYYLPDDFQYLENHLFICFAHFLVVSGGG